MTEIDRRGFCDKGDARHLAATVAPARRAPVSLHNFYVPAGGDEPDPLINPKFAHKLAFLDEMAAWIGRRRARRRAMRFSSAISISPRWRHDVWSHKALLSVVSHTPIEVEKLGRVQAAGPWVDAMRRYVPAEEKLYTWWSYRSRDWALSNKGRRLDHVWVSQSLAPRLGGMQVAAREPRLGAALGSRAGAGPPRFLITSGGTWRLRADPGGAEAIPYGLEFGGESAEPRRERLPQAFGAGRILAEDAAEQLLRDAQNTRGLAGDRRGRPVGSGQQGDLADQRWRPQQSASRPSGLRSVEGDRTGQNEEAAVRRLVAAKQDVASAQLPRLGGKSEQTQGLRRKSRKNQVARKRGYDVLRDMAMCPAGVARKAVANGRQGTSL